MEGKMELNPQSSPRTVHLPSSDRWPIGLQSGGGRGGLEPTLASPNPSDGGDGDEQVGETLTGTDVLRMPSTNDKMELLPSVVTNEGLHIVLWVRGRVNITTRAIQPPPKEE